MRARLTLQAADEAACVVGRNQGSLARARARPSPQLGKARGQRWPGTLCAGEISTTRLGLSRAAGRQGLAPWRRAGRHRRGRESAMARPEAPEGDEQRERARQRNSEGRRPNGTRRAIRRRRAWARQAEDRSIDIPSDADDGCGRRRPGLFLLRRVLPTMPGTPGALGPF